MKINTRKLAIQYSLIQGTYWAAFCIIYAFATVFLLSRGFRSGEIGIIVALGNILGVILQPVAASVADSSKRPTLQQLTVLFTVATALLLLALCIVPSLPLAVGAVFLLTDAMLQTVQPLINSVSVYYVNQGVPVDFGAARGVGSISYAAASWLLGKGIERFGTGLIPAAGILVLLLCGGLLLSLPAIPKASLQETHASEAAATKGSGLLRFFGKYKYFTVTLAGLTLSFTFHNMSNSYLIQIVESLGGDSAHMGTALSIAAVTELPVMLLFSFLIRRFHSSALLKVSAVVFAVKAVGFLVARGMSALYLIQILQMGSFALFVPASVYYVNETMDAQDKFKGQAVMTGTNTLGGVFGSLLGGFLVDFADVRAMLAVECAIAILGAGLVCLCAGRTEKGKAKQP